MYLSRSNAFKCFRFKIKRKSEKFAVGLTGQTIAYIKFGRIFKKIIIHYIGMQVNSILPLTQRVSTITITAQK